MRQTSRYHLIIEDRSRLEQVCDIRLLGWRVALLVLGVGALCVATGMLLMGVTPLRHTLPASLDGEGRTAIEQYAWRVDSLTREVDRYGRYVESVRQLFAPEEVRSRPGNVLSSISVEKVDSLLAPSREELSFAKRYAERERRRLASEVRQPVSMMFSPPSADCVVQSPDDASPAVARVIMAAGTPVGAPAEGRVVAAYFDPASGWAVVIQHSRGYVSRYSRLGRPLVGEGDHVEASQIIALTSEGRGRAGEHIEFELWLNGDPVAPHRYIEPA